MSQHHLVTHAYDSHTGWVRIPRTELTSQSAEELRSRGFTMVRLRRGMFGFRDVSIRRYLRDPSPADTSPTDVVPAATTSTTVASSVRHGEAEDFLVDLVPAAPPARG
jgi:hypothetical protein